ncbi:peptide-binding protein [Enterococcus faecalis]|uniref:Peptide-binding protein n=5 Tax=Lactobacillales TaxID=186826 RepID=A0A0N0DNX6_STRSU|nr:Omega transcriptional repressor [Streptococcus suis D12]ATZ03658.1 peptide-binding protein [Streptococcus suis]EGO2621846.1 peptide-binding protein [Enterococcus faecalis]KAF0089459.1 peptide-binding protein [Streptococcus agalactiae]OQO71687.1 peptide-binding protein [Enterococcus villorum]PQC48265.1 peptide-binding protein [Enterococcus faecium]HAP5018529.1 peptide-binding protein [Enterococcus faecalis EX166083VC26]
MIVGNLGAQKEKRNDTPISAKKDIMGDKTVRVRADLHHIIKFCIIGIEVKLDAKNL